MFLTSHLPHPLILNLRHVLGVCMSVHSVPLVKWVMPGGKTMYVCVDRPSSRLGCRSWKGTLCVYVCVFASLEDLKRSNHV